MKTIIILLFMITSIFAIDKTNLESNFIQLQASNGNIYYVNVNKIEYIEIRQRYIIISLNPQDYVKLCKVRYSAKALISKINNAKY